MPLLRDWRIRSNRLLGATRFWWKLRSYLLRRPRIGAGDQGLRLPHGEPLPSPGRQLGLKQEVLRPQIATQNEIDPLQSDGFYYDALKGRLAAIRPAYLYERLVLGNFAAARLSRELQIPYILEYNGSEISMNRSFGGSALEHESAFSRGGAAAAFEQATVISSSFRITCRDDVLSRGNCSRQGLRQSERRQTALEYSPPREERREIRASLGLSDEARG